MIKDPLNTEETPYDILEIDVNTPMNDIHQALPRFMKKNKVVSKISIAQEAIRKLKNIQDRITYDITYYALEVMESTSLDTNIDISEIISKQISIPPIIPIDYCKDLFSDVDSIELPELDFQTVEIQTIKDFHNQKIIQLTMPFERKEHHGYS